MDGQASATHNLPRHTRASVASVRCLCPFRRGKRPYSTPAVATAIGVASFQARPASSAIARNLIASPLSLGLGLTVCSNDNLQIAREQQNIFTGQRYGINPSRMDETQTRPSRFKRHQQQSAAQRLAIAARASAIVVPPHSRAHSHIAQTVSKTVNASHDDTIEDHTRQRSALRLVQTQCPRGIIVHHRPQGHLVIGKKTDRAACPMPQQRARAYPTHCATHISAGQRVFSASSNDGAIARRIIGICINSSARRSNLPRAGGLLSELLRSRKLVVCFVPCPPQHKPYSVTQIGLDRVFQPVRFPPRAYATIPVRDAGFPPAAQVLLPVRPQGFPIGTVVIGVADSAGRRASS